MSDTAQSAKARARQVLDPLAEFLRKEAAGGVALIVTAAVALLWANSPAGDDYFTLWAQEVKIGFGSVAITAAVGAALLIASRRSALARRPTSSEGPLTFGVKGRVDRSAYVLAGGVFAAFIAIQSSFARLCANEH
jgi:hypothetical protein